MTPSASTDLVRIGIIGCGVTGRRHLEAAAAVPGTQVVAVADLDHSVAARLAADFSVSTVYSDPDDLLVDPTVDAVVLALPTSVRQTLALTALSRGKHVLLEKPAAATLADVDELIAAARGLVVASCSARLRTTAAARAATRIVAAGRLGPIREIRLHGHQAAPVRPETEPPVWRLRTAANGGGILWNWGPYDLDFALGVCGWSLSPETVFGQTWPVADELMSWVPPGSDGETHGIGLVRCTGGTVLTVDRGEYLPGDSNERIEILGTVGSLSGRPSPGDGAGLRLRELDPSSGDTTIESIALTETYDDISRALIEDFIVAVRQGSGPLTSIQNYHPIAAICEAVRESGRSGELVRITTEDTGAVPVQ